MMLEKGSNLIQASAISASPRKWHLPMIAKNFSATALLKIALNHIEAGSISHEDQPGEVNA
jgi:hypothetical protein